MRTRARFLTTTAVVLFVAPLVRAQDNLRPEEHAVPKPVPTTTVDPSSPYAQALRLARMLRDDVTIARLLRARAARPDASAAELIEAMEALEAVADPAAAASLLEHRIAARPEEGTTRIALAGLLTRSGDAPKAVLIWKDIEGQFSLTTAQATEYAQALFAAGEIEAAYAVLQRARPKAADDAMEFWQAIGSLAWELDDGPIAERAYRTLWGTNQAPAAGERLLSLLVRAGDVDGAIAVALELYKLNGAAAALLLAADLRREKGDWVAVRQTLSLADHGGAEVKDQEEYWLLAGEAYGHLEETKLMVDAYEAALRINPDSVAAKAALLWHAIDKNDNARLRRQVDAWRQSASDEPDLWGPFAVGLDRLGRTRDAVVFYARQVKRTPTDHPFAIEFADALERTGKTVLADRIRRTALAHLRTTSAALLRKPQLTAEERELMERQAIETRRQAGSVKAEAWVEALLAARKRSPDSEAFAIDWYLGDGRIEKARFRLEQARRLRLEQPDWRRYRFALALADHDRATIEDIALGKGASSLEPRARIDAALELERDDLALPALRDALASNDPTEDRTDLIQIFDGLRFRHAPYAKGGAFFSFITGLETVGAQASASHEWGSRRMIYGVTGRRMSATDRALVPTESMNQLDANALVRWATPRQATELGLGVSYQPDHPFPTGVLFHQRELANNVAVTLDLNVGSPIDDTALLRFAAVRSQALANVRVELPYGYYASAEVEAHEDTTRTARHLGVETAGTTELGYRILKRVPEWDIALQAIGSVRRNNEAAILALVPGATSIDLLAPPSYGLVSIVTHFVRGDFLGRHRPSEDALPHYDCEGGVGVLVPDGDISMYAQCGLSLRTSADGTLSGVGVYRRGAVGIPGQTIAETWLSYAHHF
jgi:tetratricopeptide (TPR) repeat protein